MGNVHLDIVEVVLDKIEFFKQRRYSRSRVVVINRNDTGVAPKKSSDQIV